MPFSVGQHYDVPANARLIEVGGHVQVGAAGGAAVPIDGDGDSGGVGWLHAGSWRNPRRRLHAQIVAVAFTLHDWQRSWYGAMLATGDVRGLAFPAMPAGRVPFRHLVASIKGAATPGDNWDLSAGGTDFARVQWPGTWEAHDGVLPNIGDPDAWVATDNSGGDPLLIHVTTMHDAARYGVQCWLEVAPLSPGGGAVIDAGRTLKPDQGAFHFPQPCHNVGDARMLPWHAGIQPGMVNPDQALVCKVQNLVGSWVEAPARVGVRVLLALFDPNPEA